MRIEVFAEFAGWDALAPFEGSVTMPPRDQEPTVLLGKETASDPVLLENLKLYYTKEEESR